MKIEQNIVELLEDVIGAENILNLEIDTGIPNESIIKFKIKKLELYICMKTLRVSRFMSIDTMVGKRIVMGEDDITETLQNGIRNLYETRHKYKYDNRVVWGQS